MPSPKLDEPPHAAVWKPRLRIAVAQMEVRDDIARNRRVILQQLDETKRKHGAKLVVFPETAVSGYAPEFPGGKTVDQINFAELKRAEADIRDAIKKLKLTVAIGTTDRRGGKFYNTSLLIGPDGRIVGRYDKVHLTGQVSRNGDSVCFQRGAKSCLKVLPAAGTKVGMQICFDMRFPESWRVLALGGARLLLHPTAAFGRDSLWKREAIEGNLSSRASENSCWLASANSAGPHQFMTSRIIDPDGLVIVQPQIDAEQVVSAAIDPDWLGRSRGFLSSRRPDCYTGLAAKR